MKLIRRYIRQHVLYGIVGALLVLVSLYAFSLFISEIDKVGRGSYDLSSAALYVLLTLPRRIYELFPTAALIGALFGLGSLANHHELIVLRASGVSINRIVSIVLRLGLGLMVFVIAFGEWIVPLSEQAAQNLRTEALYNRPTLNTEYGYWSRDGQRFINVGHIHMNGELQHIRLYDFDDDFQLKRVLTAQKAQFHDQNWQLLGVEEKIFHLDTVQQVFSESLHVEGLLEQDLLKILVVKPEYLSLWGLHQYINYLNSSGQSSRLYELAFWKKVFSPLIMLVMIYSAMSFIFGPLRSVTTGKRIFLGVIVGVVFHMLSQILHYAGLVYHLNLLLSVATPAVLFLLWGVFMMRRVQ